MLEPSYLEQLLRINGLTRESGREKIGIALAGLGWGENDISTALAYYFENKKPGEKDPITATVIRNGSGPELLFPQGQRPPLVAPHVSHSHAGSFFFVVFLFAAAGAAFYFRNELAFYMNNFVASLSGFH
jgi:hypothetical protein